MLQLQILMSAVLTAEAALAGDQVPSFPDFAIIFSTFSRLA
jgi:hypothetical protein